MVRSPDAPNKTITHEPAARPACTGSRSTFSATVAMNRSPTRSEFSGQGKQALYDAVFDFGEARARANEGNARSYTICEIRPTCGCLFLRSTQTWVDGAVPDCLSLW